MNDIIISNKKPIVIGRQGENNVTTIQFAIDALFPHIQNATYGLVHQRHGDAAPYPVTTMAIGGYVNWVINSGDVGNVGNGTAQLTAYKDGAVAKSIIFTTITLTSMGTTDAPDPVQLYIDRIVRAGQEAVNAAADAEESAEAAASSAEAAAGSAEAASGSAEAAAQSASDAQQILDDISSTVETELTEAKESGEFDGPRGYSVYGGSNIIIANWTDGTHTENYCVDKVDAPDAGIGDFILGKRNGEISLMKVAREDANHLFGDGVMDLIGQMGQDGEDGYSPTVSVTTITGGHRVTITDASGAHSFDVMDGEDGEGGGSNTGIYGGSNVIITYWTDGTQTEACSVSKSDVPGAVVGDFIIGKRYGELSIMKAVRENTGMLFGDETIAIDAATIPTKTSDLTNDSGFVNASGAASAAPVQSVNGQTGDVTITVPAAASSGTPAMDGTASRGGSTQYARADHRHPSDTTKYTKPSTGIPKSDLASAVQTSLGKADTALQSVPSTYRTAAAQNTIDAGKIDKPSNPATGAFLVWNGSTWSAQTLATWQGGNY